MTKSESALKEKTVSFINPKKEQSNNKKGAVNAPFYISNSLLIFNKW